MLSSVNCFLPFTICNIQGASGESEGLYGKWWPLGELMCDGLIFGWALAVMSIFWCFHNYSRFSLLGSKALKWSPWTLLAFAPLICVPLLLSSLSVVLLYLGCRSLFFSYSCLVFLFFCFFFPILRSTNPPNAMICSSLAAVPEDPSVPLHM